MKRLLFFKSGRTLVVGHGHDIRYHGDQLASALDITEADDAEIKLLIKNPNDHSLRQKIGKRQKLADISLPVIADDKSNERFDTTLKKI